MTDLRRLKRELARQGWSVEPTGGGHWKFTPPDPTKRVVFASASPSDFRSMSNVIRDLERSGFRAQEGT